MNVVVKLDLSKQPETVQVDDVLEFTERHPRALTEVNGRWVPFEKKFPILEF